MTRTGLVLAGGESLRFGSSKTFAPFGRQPMLRRVCDALRVHCDEILVSVAADVDTRRVLEVVPEARVVRDERKGRGPIEGFLRGFAAARGELVLVAPSDAPLLRPALYAALLSVLGDHEAAVPRHVAMDPVRAVYRRDAVTRVFGTEVVPSPSALVDRLDAAFLEGDALREADPTGASFVDVNGREDLEEALRIAASRA